MLQDVARDVEVDGLEKVLLDRSRAQAASRRRARTLHDAAVVEAQLAQRTGPRNSKTHTHKLIARNRAQGLSPTGSAPPRPGGAQAAPMAGGLGTVTSWQLGALHTGTAPANADSGASGAQAAVHLPGPGRKLRVSALSGLREGHGRADPRPAEAHL